MPGQNCSRIGGLAVDLGIVTIIWRETFEAILLVAIVAAFLRKREAQRATTVIVSGVALGIVLSLVLGIGIISLQDILSGAALDHFQTAMMAICALLMLH